MIVSYRVAKFLKDRLGYNNSFTLYVYDRRGEMKFSMEPVLNPVPAPTILEAIEFLWKVGIKIYNIPEGKKSRGIIQVKDKQIKMIQLDNSPSESYTECLEYLSLDLH